MEQLVIILFRLTFMLYSAAAVLYAYYFVSKRVGLGRLATVATASGWFLHTAAIGVRWRAAGFIPFDSPFEAFLASTWFVVAVYLAVELWLDVKALGVPVMPVAALMMGVAAFQYSSPSQLSSLVQDSWIVMHVVVVFLAFGGFMVSAALAVLYLIQERQLKSHTPGVLFRRLPPLQTLDDWSGTAIAFAMPFISMGIITGIVRAIQWKQGAWYLNEVVLATFLMWFVYVFYLVARWFMGWQGRKAAIISLIGFVTVLIIRAMSAGYLGFWQQLTR